MLSSLIVSTHTLKLDLHLFHTVLKLRYLVFEFIFVAVQPSSVSTLRYHMLDFIYDIAPLIFNLASEVLKGDTGFYVCRHFSHGSLHIIDVCFLADLGLQFLSTTFTFTVHHSF